MQSELFELQESLSPYQAFLKKHKIQFCMFFDLDCYEGAFFDLKPVIAHNGKYTLASISSQIEHDFEFYGDIKQVPIGHGVTEKEAAFDMAVKLKLEGYNKFNWDLK